jgi:hypothetical protein
MKHKAQHNNHVFAGGDSEMDVKNCVIKILFLAVLSTPALAVDNTIKQTPTTPDLPVAGNFILPNSQQPGPLIGFGENIVTKGTTQLFYFTDYYSATQGHQADAVPGIVYGITDRLSIFVNLPLAISYQQPNQHSAGFEDAFVQMEYAYYAPNTTTYQDEATIVASVSIPTGDADAQPQIGAGAPSYFIGTTFNRSYVNWFAFTSPGVEITTTRNGNKLGDQYYYQFGVGRNLFDIGKKWIFAFMTEVDGEYVKRNTVNGSTDPNSGGNTVFVTPSLWISSEKLIFQLGFGLPVAQNFYGNQAKDNYLVAANIGWTFT